MIIAVNGSARKGWNTHTLLTEATKGAQSAGAKTELINLYDLTYKGCTGCLLCKKKEGGSIGKCAMKDGLSPVLEKISTCRGLILGSPIYLGEVTGLMRSFMERLLFQYLSYEEDRIPYSYLNIKNAFIYTMNVPEHAIEQMGYPGKFKANAALLDRFIGPSSILISAETRQVIDYDQYKMSMFDADERIRRHKEVFPADCRKAFELGAEIAAQ